MPLEKTQQELFQEEENEDEEHLSISQLRARRKKLELAESIVPLAEVDPKRKDVDVPTSKLKKK